MEIKYYIEKNKNMAEFNKMKHVVNIANIVLINAKIIEKRWLKIMKIKSIKYVGKQDVFNMEVEKYHNFSIEGGLIVHNCMDAFRYFIKTILCRSGGTSIFK